jgi:ribosomal protein L33
LTPLWYNQAIKQNDCREGDVNGMSREVWVQCQECGELHKKEIKYNIEDIYIKAYCSRCKDKTTHLVCSEDESEIYFYYNLNTDPRYYDYTTK